MTAIKGVYYPRPEYCQELGKTRKFGAYAYFPGTGPKGRTCFHCTHTVKLGRGKGCGKYAKLMGKKALPIQTSTPACKFFEQEPVTNSPQIGATL